MDAVLAEQRRRLVSALILLALCAGLALGTYTLLRTVWIAVLAGVALGVAVHASVRGLLFPTPPNGRGGDDDPLVEGTAPRDPREIVPRKFRDRVA